MYKLPIRSPKKPLITQLFGNTSNNAWYHANGVNIPSHNGVDLITGFAQETYGTELVCPFPEATVVKVSWEDPMTTKGNGVTLEAKVGKDKFQIVLWHTGEINVKLKQKVKEGDVVCYIGNSGLCRPAPTVDRPYDGAHLHFMLYQNGILLDPLTYFNKDEWYIGEDSGLAHDISPIVWALNKLGFTEWYLKLLYAIRIWNQK